MNQLPLFSRPVDASGARIPLSQYGCRLRAPLSDFRGARLAQGAQPAVGEARSVPASSRHARGRCRGAASLAPRALRRSRPDRPCAPRAPGVDRSVDGSCPPARRPAIHPDHGPDARPGSCRRSRHARCAATGPTRCWLAHDRDARGRGHSVAAVGEGRRWMPPTSAGSSMQRARRVAPMHFGTARWSRCTASPACAPRRSSGCVGRISPPS